MEKSRRLLSFVLGVLLVLGCVGVSAQEEPVTIKYINATDAFDPTTDYMNMARRLMACAL